MATTGFTLDSDLTGLRRSNAKPASKCSWWVATKQSGRCWRHAVMIICCIGSLLHCCSSVLVSETRR